MLVRARPAQAARAARAGRPRRAPSLASCTPLPCRAREHAPKQAGGGQQSTGKRKLHARNVSHSNIKTHRWQNVNVQRRRLSVPELGRHVTLKVTTGDLRTIDKIGLLAYAKQHGVRLA